MEVKLFEGIESDPSVETVMKGAAVMTEFEPDWIVAIGGGSPIDAAKASGLSMNILIQHLKICARYSVFLSFVRKLISVQFHLHQEQLQR